MFSSLIWILVFSIIPLAILIGVIVVIVRVATSRNQNNNPNKAYNEKAGEEMLKNIYVYLILFVTLMMSIGGSVGVFAGIADLVTAPSYVESYSSFKDNEMHKYRDSVYVPQEPVEYNEFMKEQEDSIKADYAIMVQERNERHKNEAVRMIIMSFGWIIIPLPLFLFYQRQLKRKVV